MTERLVHWCQFDDEHNRWYVGKFGNVLGPNPVRYLDPSNRLQLFTAWASYGLGRHHRD